jgi:hypothetical protein
MNCLECGGNYQIRNEPIDLQDEYVGWIETRPAVYFECDNCGDRMLSPDACDAIDEAIDEELDRILQSRPLRDFMTAPEAAEELGISAQALHKHRRIRRGFIFQTKFGGKTVYLKESVRRFKESGDGRFPLQPEERYSTIEPSYRRELLIHSFNQRVAEGFRSYSQTVVH